MAVTGTVEIALEVPVSASLSVIAPLAHPIFEIDPSPSVAVRKRNVPKIFGTFPNNAGRFDNTFGPEHATGSDAIYVIGPGVTHVSVNSDGEYPNWAIGFDASRSSVIYGASETVQPASIRALALIRAY